MQKLLLLSMLIAAVAIPAWASGTAHPARAVKKAVLYTFFFNLLYLLALRIIYPRLG
jgi:hypothetical protein